MTPWLWIALISNFVSFAGFLWLLGRRRWTGAGLAVGVVHMLIATTFSVAPIRSAIDPNYPGLAFGSSVSTGARPCCRQRSFSRGRSHAPT